MKQHVGEKDEDRVRKVKSSKDREGHSRAAEIGEAKDT